MAKKKAKKPVVAPTMTKKQLSRWQKEKRQERLALGFVIAVIVLVAAVILLGIYQENIAKPNAAIARVNGTAISVGTFAKVMGLQGRNLDRQAAYWQDQYQLLAQSGDPSQSYLQQLIQQQTQQIQQAQQQLLFTVPDDLIADELIRQETEKRGLTVSPAEIDAAIVQMFQPTAQEPVTDTTSTTPTPTPIPANAWQENYKQYLTSLNVSDADYRELALLPSLRREKLQRVLSETVATSGEQIRLSHIVTDTEDAALAFLAQIQAGADFEIMAKALSGDTATAEIGGDLGWYPHSALVNEFSQAFEDAAFALKKGQVVTAPVATYYGYHIIKATDYDPNRIIEADKLAPIQAAALENWLAVQVKSPAVERLVDSSKQFWVQTQVAKQNLPKK